MEKLQKATFGAGCFWGIEAGFQEIKGVVDTAVGYMGGTLANPTYEDVCGHQTGHAQVVEVTYNDELISYETLLENFWKMHDPTTVNRQGPDIGDQYRSVIFFHSPEQKELAEKSKAKLNEIGKYQSPIVTQMMPAETFWKAEEYHQKYLEKNGLAVCH